MAKQTFTTGQVLTAAQMTSLQQTAMLGGDASAKVASYVLVAADAGTAISMSNGSATTITVNTGLFAAGDIVTIINLGAGVCTITAGTATVTTSGSLALAQNQGGVLRFTSASAAIFFQFATPASGDIEGVTAGTGISGGGTSGTVTITNSMATEITAKGDLIVGTGNATFDNLPVGTNGYTLVADSVEATGLKWAAPASGGMTLISTTTLTGASVLISSIPATYNDLQIVIRNFKPTNDGHDLTIRVNDDSNANRHKLANDFSSVSTTAFSDTLWSFGTANDNTVSQFFGLFQIWDYANTTTWKLGNWYEMTTDPTTNTSFRYRAGRMMYNQTGAISSFRIATESGGGDLNGGEVLLYGVK
jgi:hypothetical protein